MKRRVVITGLGTLNPIGNSVEEAWKNCKAGVCGIGEITAFDASEFKVKVAAEVKSFKPEDYMDKKEARRMDRYTQLAVAAANEAVKDSGLDMEKEDADRCGVLVSSGIGGLDTLANEHSRGLERGFEKVSPLFIPMCISNMAAGQIAIAHGFKGMCSCVVTACAGGTNAVGDAFHYIRDGYSEVMLCGGAEATVTPFGIGGFASMKALSLSENPNRASIPFDKERGGFVLGEGAGILVLEEYEHAKARGAKIYGEVVGYGTSCDAYHITAPSPDGSGAAKCMENAVKDADLALTDVEYINAHGTSTHLNDVGETKAIRMVFGDHADKLMVSSTKSMTGHMLGGTGAVEAIFTTLALKDGFVPATINYQVPDEECDLDIVPNEGRQADIRVAMSNSLGFGGHNACIVIKKFEE